MENMNKKEFDDIMKFRIKTSTFETGYTREERFIINKINSERIFDIEERYKRNDSR